MDYEIMNGISSVFLGLTLGPIAFLTIIHRNVLILIVYLTAVTATFGMVYSKNQLTQYKNFRDGVEFNVTDPNYQHWLIDHKGVDD